MLVRVAFALEASKRLHSGEPTYPDEPVVIQLCELLAVNRETQLARVVDENGPGDIHVSRLYNVHTDETQGEIELASWTQPA
jgi:hypothetical protein